MKSKLIILLLVCTTSLSAHGSLNEFKSKIRPYVEEYLGDEVAIKIFGPKKETITLPEIPIVNNSALDATVFNEKEDPKSKDISKKDKEQSDYFFVEEVYLATRKVAASSEELNRWVSILSQGGKREGVYRALVLDDTYRGLENYEDTPNDLMMNFTSYYLSTFLNKKVKKEALAKVNFYSLKKLVVKNTLDVADEFIKNDKQNLYRWYAVFSSDLATRYPEAFDKKLRKIGDRSVHLNWANKFPDQNVKSEIIIKIHHVFNYLKG